MCVCVCIKHHSKQFQDRILLDGSSKDTPSLLLKMCRLIVLLLH